MSEPYVTARLLTLATGDEPIAQEGKRATTTAIITKEQPKRTKM